MKIKKLLLIYFLTFLTFNSYAQTSNLNNKFVPLKDFLILKFDLFLKENVKNIFQGGGMTHIAYQKINYNTIINDKDEITILIDAIMDKKRYSSKRYYPKLKDCIQVRNKLIANKFGYSFLKQSFNNLVNTETLSYTINENILNISSLNVDLKKKITNGTNIVINVMHPKSEKSIGCEGKLTDTLLKLTD